MTATTQSLTRLGLECVGLNLLVAALAAGGAEFGAWAADTGGSGIGLVVGLAAGMVTHTLGATRLADAQLR